MIITIILASMLALAIIGIILRNHLPDTTVFICWLITVTIGVSALFVSVMVIDNAVRADYLYKQDMIEYTALQTIADSDKSVFISFSEDIINFNLKVEKYQTYHDNPWVNWFFYKGCENVPYIEIKEAEQ